MSGEEGAVTTTNGLSIATTSTTNGSYVGLSVPPPMNDLDAGFAGELSEPTRSAALAALKQGALKRLTFKARVFKAGPNRNSFRFYDEDLREFASSFAGVPFLRNHDTSDIGSRDGTIRKSMLGEDGSFVQEIELTTERGMTSFLEGQIDRFSIGWHYEGVKCSVCGGDWFEADCSHWPGRKYMRGKAGGEVACELYFVGPRGKEVSAVNVPAVPGTGLLSELIDMKEQRMKKQGGAMVLDELVLEIDAEQGREQTEGPDEDGKVAMTADAEQGAQLFGQAVSPGAVALQEQGMATREQKTPTSNAPIQHDSSGAPSAVEAAWSESLRLSAIEGRLTNSGLSEAGREAVRTQFGMFRDAGPDKLDELIRVQKRVDSAYAQSQVVKNMRPGLGAQVVETERDRVQGVVDYVMGVKGTKTPALNLRSMRDLYLWMTEDYDFHGRWSGMNPSLAAANTLSLPAMVVNALNKILVEHYIELGMYRWHEKISVAMPHDGSTQDVQLITLGGMSNLPVVPEGAAYTEKEISDRKVVATFSKYGAYIGITLEMIRRNDIGRMQMFPRQMMIAAIRTRSATIANIFTQASGVGPTLSYDSTALFHNNHGNLDTAAFSFDAWKAARIRISKQTELGSGARLGYLPRYALLPIDLYDTALNIFGYGQGSGGAPGTPNNDLNPYAEDRPNDPRPVPVVVPEFTDTTDWACIVDPKLVPIIQIAYANNPPGGSHPMPEIFTVEAENQGMMFSNDTMPIKIRDWWSVGVASHLGIGKNNVAG